jgi:hypothetical protein
MQLFPREKILTDVSEFHITALGEHELQSQIHNYMIVFKVRDGY